MRADVNTMKNTTLKNLARTLDTSDERKRRENDRRGASQSYPGDECPLSKTYVAHRESQEDGDWPADEHQEKGNRKSRRRDSR